MLRRIVLSVVAAIAVCVVANQASAQAPSVLYNPFNGNVKFQDFNQVAGMRFFSDGGNLIPNVGADLGFALTEKTATLYSWLTFATPITGAELDAGNIVQIGTPVADLRFDYKPLTFTALDTPGIIVAVPEPSSIALAGLGLLGAVAIRRRRRAA